MPSAAAIEIVAQGQVRPHMHEAHGLRGICMFMEADRPAPLPAEGAYWLFMPLGVALATPAFIGLFAFFFDQTLTPALASAVDGYRALLLVPITPLQVAAAGMLPDAWRGVVADSTPDIALSSFAGGAYIAAWVAARLQRTVGLIGAVVLAVLLVLGLGITFLGLGSFVVAYLLAFLLLYFGYLPIETENGQAIVASLLAPPVLGGAFVATNMLDRESSCLTRRERFA